RGAACRRLSRDARRRRVARRLRGAVRPRARRRDARGGGAPRAGRSGGGGSAVVEIPHGRARVAPGGRLGGAARPPPPPPAALEIVAWDSTLVGAKLRRALAGRDRTAKDSWTELDRVQNDANGSAKVALISLDRSAAAWRLVADAMQDASASDLAALASRLRS